MGLNDRDQEFWLNCFNTIELLQRVEFSLIDLKYRFGIEKNQKLSKNDFIGTRFCESLTELSDNWHFNHYLDFKIKYCESISSNIVLFRNRLISVFEKIDSFIDEHIDKMDGELILLLISVDSIILSMIHFLHSYYRDFDLPKSKNQEKEMNHQMEKGILKSRDKRLKFQMITNPEIAYTINELFSTQLDKLQKNEKIELLNLITGKSGNDLYSNLSGTKNLTKNQREEILAKIAHLSSKIKSK